MNKFTKQFLTVAVLLVIADIYGCVADGLDSSPTPKEPDAASNSVEESYLEGKRYYDQNDFNKALPLLKPSAQQGNVDAQQKQGIAAAQTNLPIILDCVSTHKNINVRFVARSDEAQLLIEDETKRKYTCTSAARFLNQKNYHAPAYRIEMNSMFCNPRLPFNVRDEIIFKKDLFSSSGEATLLWVTFSKALPCSINKDRLESHFSVIESKQNKNQMK
jgi:hypothetical protein